MANVYLSMETQSAVTLTESFLCRPAKGDILADSGPYSYGIAYGEKSLKGEICAIAHADTSIPLYVS